MLGFSMPTFDFLRYFPFFVRLFPFFIVHLYALGRNASSPITSHILPIITKLINSSFPSKWIFRERILGITLPRSTLYFKSEALLCTALFEQLQIKRLLLYMSQRNSIASKLTLPVSNSSPVPPTFGKSDFPAST